MKWLTSIFLLLGTKLAFAADKVTLPNPLCPENDPTCKTSLPDIIHSVFHFLAIDIGPLVVIIFVLVGAYQMIFSGGEAEKFTKGKTTIVYTVVGYAVLLMANGIAAIIQTILTGK